jgi:hypothetical protein
MASTTRLFLQVAPQRERYASDFDKEQFGIYIETAVLKFGLRHQVNATYDQDRMRYLRIRVGYRETFSVSNGEDNLTEQRIVGQITARLLGPKKVVFALRNEMDWRWIEDVYSWRYRIRLEADRDFRMHKVKLSPYANAEAFYDSRYDAWSQTRYELGLAVPATSWLVPKIYYAVQLTDQPTDSRINALGIMAIFYF